VAERACQRFAGEHEGQLNLAKVLGVDAGETVDCEWAFRRLLGIDEGEEIDNEQLVRLLLGIDDHEDLDSEQVLRLLDTAAADGRTGG
jgi:hypothetical protein